MAGRIPISMIIHVYNNEQALPTCLDSIISQGSLDFEVVLVNNGSTDGSVAICENYREKDRRVQVVHMEHDDVAVAYNNGLEAAGGRYIHFVDANDQIKEGVIEEVQSVLRHNLDVVFVDTSFYRSANFWDISHSNILRRLCQDMPDRLWDKLIRRELLEKDDIRFTKGLVWEKVDFSIKLYLHALTYTAVDFPYYSKTENTNKPDPEGVFSKIILTLSKWAGPAEFVYEDHTHILHSWMAAMYCDYLIPMFKQLPKESREMYKRGMGDFQWLFDVRHERKDKLIKILYAVCGPLVASYALSVFK